MENIGGLVRLGMPRKFMELLWCLAAKLFYMVATVTIIFTIATASIVKTLAVKSLDEMVFLKY